MLEDLAYDIKLTLEALRAREMQTAEGRDAARVVYIADTVSGAARAERPAAPRAAPARLRRLSLRGRAGERRPISGVRRGQLAAGERVGAPAGKPLRRRRWKAKADRRSRCRSRKRDASRRRAPCGACCGSPRICSRAKSGSSASSRRFKRDAANQAEHRAPADQHRESQDVPVAHAGRDGEARRCRQAAGSAADRLPDSRPARRRGHRTATRCADGARLRGQAFLFRGRRDRAARIPPGQPGPLRRRAHLLRRSERVVGAAQAFAICARLSVSAASAPFQAKAVVVGAPSKPDKERLRTQEAHRHPRRAGRSPPKRSRRSSTQWRPRP